MLRIIFYVIVVLHWHKKKVKRGIEICFLKKLLICIQKIKNIYQWENKNIA